MDVSTNEIKSKIIKGFNSGIISLSSCSLTDWPTDIKNFGDIEPPIAWHEIEPIKSIDVSHNELVSIPESIDRFADLISINLQYNLIKEFPRSLICNLNNLKNISLKNNKLCEIPDISDAIALVYLDLSENQITSIPKLPESLIDLNLSDNNITVATNLPKNLIKLDLRKNKISTLPGSLPSRIEVIDLSYNKIQGVRSSTFSELKNLKWISLGWNQCVGTISNIFPRAVNLKHLDLTQNRFNDQGIFDVLAKKFPNLGVALLSGNCLTCPLSSSTKWELNDMNTVDISNNNIKELCSSIGLAKNLVRFSFTGNMIRKAAYNSKSVDELKKYLRGENN